MVEYIEREALEGSFDAAAMAFLEKEDHLFDRKSVLAGMSVVAGIVHTVPAANVAPVVHGRWRLLPVSIRSIKKTNIPEAVCSICGERFCDITNSVTLYRYCPNCGAKMDLQEG